MSFSRCIRFVGVHFFAFGLLLVFPAGCQRTLIATPYAMYGDTGRETFDRTPEALRTPEIPVIFVTDRLEAKSDEPDPRGVWYGYGRDLWMSYGVARVGLGKNVQWATLVDDSTRAARSRSYTPKVVQVEPKGRFGNALLFYEAAEGRLRVRADAIETHERELEGFNALLSEWLGRTHRKEVVVFVHGFNNRFEHGILRLAEAWHMAGRIGVPIVYTWPAGSGGIKGYAYDRESGEFTVVHLKLLLAALAVHPAVEKVHLVAHSRGTDVAVTALRELHAEIRGATRNSMLGSRFGKPDADPMTTYEALRLSTLVLAAPDMDLDVFAQRFFGENLFRAAERIVIYFSDKDEAIGLADWLFKSRRRIGAMRIEDFKPESLALFGATPSIELIECGVTGVNSHSYLVEHPAALSDLIVLLRTGAPAGSAERPLTRPVKGIWGMDNSYLKPAEPGAE